MNKTWFIDIDGTILKHRNNLALSITQNANQAGTEDDGEVLLPSVKEFFETIPENDQIVLVTARHTEHREITEKALERFGLLERVNSMVYDVCSGPRILINDIKPIGAEDNILVDKEVDTAYAINVRRDEGLRHLINDDGNC